MARRRPVAPAARRAAPPSPAASGSGAGRSSASRSAEPTGSATRRAGSSARRASSGDRPARRSKPPGPTVYEQVRVPRLVTARALVLGVVVLLAFVLVYPTAQSALAQQAKLNAAQHDLAAAKARKAELGNDLVRWSDPAYVTSQARSRLSFVMPGERAFRVVDPQTATDEPDLGNGPVSTDTWSGRAWYADVWTSVKVAGG